MPAVASTALLQARLVMPLGRLVAEAPRCESFSAGRPVFMA
jgi:hypothetical protein